MTLGQDQGHTIDRDQGPVQKIIRKDNVLIAGLEVGVITKVENTVAPDHVVRIGNQENLDTQEVEVEADTLHTDAIATEVEVGHHRLIGVEVADTEIHLPCQTDGDIKGTGTIQNHHHVWECLV